MSCHVHNQVFLWDTSYKQICWVTGQVHLCFGRYFQIDLQSKLYWSAGFESFQNSTSLWTLGIVKLSHFYKFSEWTWYLVVGFFFFFIFLIPNKREYIFHILTIHPGFLFCKLPVYILCQFFYYNFPLLI